MSSVSKILAILDLFQDGSISIHHDDVTMLVKTSRPTAYRYLRELMDAGLIAQANSSNYVLGPRILELDRLLRMNDPLITAGRQVMEELSAQYGYNLVLCSYYRDRVMCAAIAWPETKAEAMYERGRPLSMFHGAMAKVILANLSPYQLRNMILKRGDEIKAAELGQNWNEFRDNMSQIRREGCSVTFAEVMENTVGLGAPVFAANGKVLGSITFAIPDKNFRTLDEGTVRGIIIDAGRRITELIAARHTGAGTLSNIGGAKKIAPKKIAAAATQESARPAKTVAASAKVAARRRQS
ncbi:MAG: IclR family transcriptional regulator C-terminal domain-containing protein [Pseudomonadota bacterium]